MTSLLFWLLMMAAAACIVEDLFDQWEQRNVG